MGISTAQRVHRNLTPSQLYEHALRRREGVVTSGGPFAAVTAPHTGRSPNDKFLVQEPDSTKQIWWGKVNQPIAPDNLRLPPPPPARRSPPPPCRFASWPHRWETPCSFQSCLCSALREWCRS